MDTRNEREARAPPCGYEYFVAMEKCLSSSREISRVLIEMKA